MVRLKHGGCAEAEGLKWCSDTNMLADGIVRTYLAKDYPRATAIGWLHLPTQSNYRAGATAAGATLVSQRTFVLPSNDIAHILMPLIRSILNIAIVLVC